MLNKQEIEKIFKDTGVMLEGHFLLTSGRHSDKYMQCARLFEYPSTVKSLATRLRKCLKEHKLTLL